MKTEDEWDARFGGAVDSPEGSTTWNMDADFVKLVETQDANTFWSVYETENESLILIPGIHRVNIIGYVVSERAITQDELETGEWSETLWFDSAELERLPTL